MISRAHLFGLNHGHFRACNLCSRHVVRLVFFGSDNYSLLHLRALEERHCQHKDVCIAHVVTTSAKTPVANHCNNLGLNYSIWPRDTLTSDSYVSTLINYINHLKSSHSDDFITTSNEHSMFIGLVISFGRFLPIPLIEQFSNGSCINIHPSLLPRWKGSSPLLYTLLSGDSVAGISVMRIRPSEKKFDSGPIIYQKSIALSDTPIPITTPSQLAHYLIPYSINAMFEVILSPRLINSDGVSQNEIADSHGISEQLAPKPNWKLGIINWAEQSAQELLRVWSILNDVSIPMSAELLLTDSRTRLRSYYAQVRFIERPIIVIPRMLRDGGLTQSSNVENNTYLEEAANLLSNFPFGCPPGTILYLRSQAHSAHHVIPFMFVSCKEYSINDGNDNCSLHPSWIAFPTLVVHWPNNLQSKRLTALEFHNGYLNQEIAEFSVLTKLSSKGYCIFGQFQSCENMAVLGLPKPWTKHVSTIH